MKLYKNVSLEDLDLILMLGILPIDTTGNDNWESGRRAKNATDKVYLFLPTGGQNYFPEYGKVRLTVECDAVEAEIPEHDSHQGKYREFSTDRVLPEQIVAIDLPTCLISKNARIRARLDMLPDTITDRINCARLVFKVNDKIYDSWSSHIPDIWAACLNNPESLMATTCDQNLNPLTIEPTWFRIVE